MALSRACPICKANGHDSKGDHLFLMRDGKRWCCNKSQHHPDGKAYFEDTEGNVVKGGQDDSKVETNGSIFELLNNRPSAAPVAPTPVSSTLRDVGETVRGILPATFKTFKVQGKYDASGKLTALEHKVYECGTGAELTGKGRTLDKKDFYMTCEKGHMKGKKVQFFGQSIWTRAKRLLIVEGELDALSAYQMLDPKWKIVVWSLPFGANMQAFMNNADELRKFKEVYICFDNDTEGKKLSKEVASFIPKAKFLNISEKDANDMLVAGKGPEFVSAFWDADIYRPDTIIRVADVIDKVMMRPTMGVPWPWPTLTAKTYGRNPGQGIYVGAGVKIGKSEFINEVVAFDVAHKRKIAVLKYEEPPFMTVKRIAGKLDKVFYHKPGVVYSDVALKATALSIGDYLLMYPAFGPATWTSTREFVTYAALSGYTTIIIDPVTKLTNGLTTSDTETELRKLSDDIACMAQDMGFFYIITCHLKAPTVGPPHERGGRVNSNQFRGSRAMMENTYYMLGIERNKDPLLSEDEQNTSTFVLLEDRNFGNTASFPVFYNKADQSYLEPPAGVTLF